MNGGKGGDVGWRWRRSSIHKTFSISRWMNLEEVDGGKEGVGIGGGSLVGVG